MMIQIEEKDYFALLDKIGFLESKIDGLEGYSKALLDRNIMLKNKVTVLERKKEGKPNPSVDFLTFKRSKKVYTERIAANINAYYNTYKEKPKMICMSSALFEVLSGGYADPDKSTFADIKVVVYYSDNLDFNLIKETYTFEVKTDD